jgi:hypothetical protein
MMGDSDPQRSLFYQISLEKFVSSEHPLRRIRPLIDDQEIRRICKPLYSSIGRPSIPPEQLFLALIGGYLLGVPSERKLVMELQCNMAALVRRPQPGSGCLGCLDVQPESETALRRVGSPGEGLRFDGEASDGCGPGEPPRQRRWDAGTSQRELQELRADRADRPERMDRLATLRNPAFPGNQLIRVALSAAC